jgi:hypothetical protein
MVQKGICLALKLRRLILGYAIVYSTQLSFLFPAIFRKLREGIG